MILTYNNDYSHFLLLVVSEEGKSLRKRSDNLARLESINPVV